MGEEKFLGAIGKAKSALKGPLKEIDHRRHPNPCFAVCKGQWKKKISEHPNVKVMCDIRELALCMERCGEEQHKGTTHENDWGHCHHDRLLMMTSKEN